jgi:uroporphyrinogen-III synthase
MRILVTRPKPDGERTAALLRARGCDVMLVPLLRMEVIAAEFDDGRWDAVALTSANAVRALAGHPRLKNLRAIPVFAVGRRTADAARALGFANIASADGAANDLVRLIAARHGSGERILHLAGEERAADLAAALAETGIEVRTKVVYRAVAAGKFPPEVRDALAAGRIGGVLHFSRRSAEAYVACAVAVSLLSRALEPAHYCLAQQVAEPLIAAGAAAIRIAPQPTEAALIGLIAA